MTNATQAAALTTLAEVEKVTAVLLPEPSTAIVALEAAAPPVAADIRKRMAELDMTNTTSIIGFGSAAQAELQVISQAMLQDVKNKDVGPAGDSLRDIVSTIRGFSVSELDVRRKSSWWEKLLGRAAPFANFVAKFETVQAQIDKITDNLLKHETTLLKDIKSLDMLYGKTLNFYNELALYIAAVRKSSKNSIPLRSLPRKPHLPPRPKQNRLWRRRNCAICGLPVMIWNAVSMI